MKTFDFTWEYRNRHYTGRTITKLEIRLFGFELFEYNHADDGGPYHHFRLSFFTAVMFHLFTGHPNYLGRSSHGWEIGMSTLRYGTRLNRIANWSFGWTREKGMKHTGGPVWHRVWSLPFGFKFCDHNSIVTAEQMYPEWYPEWYNEDYYDCPYEPSEEEIRESEQSQADDGPYGRIV